MRECQNTYRTTAAARTMRRRTLLASTAALLPAALSGCQTGPETSGNLVDEVPTASFQMTAVTDAELPEKVLYSLQSYPDEDPDAALLERIRDGGATTEGTRPPLPANRHIATDDAVVELSKEVVGETPATTYSVKVDIVQDSIQDDEAIRFTDLPEVDRTVFSDKGLADGDVVGIGTTLLYTHEERKQSVLVPESEYAYIVWENGAEAEWVVDDAYEMSLKTYDYSAEEVATVVEYGQQMREQFAFEFSGLSSEQRDIVETATGDERYVVRADETTPQPLVELADQFRPQEQARGLDESGEDDLSGSYIVRYEGEIYWTTFVVNGESFATSTPS
ncbi:hypothetical protein SAMN05216559_2313 [Halomicrobium zhouii]|uniref:Uncharacterized protein n=1 Tax=Halomicrobium zhouii TaxID=767519 RepID=A0A1I6L9J6_9EURY|nr:hypothetical protein [Halomicrobium zhouii]SFS00122.1 hypothetical protein SAMN05216559_2313 [Halomicrobium zhouii]